MTSTKLRSLERQLLKGGGVESEGGSSTKALMAFQSVIEGEANALIKAAEDKQHAAEAIVEGLRKQITELNKQLVQAQKDTSNKMEVMRASMKQENAAMCKGYTGEIHQLQGQCNAIQKELTDEQQARVRAETQKEAAERMCTLLEQTITKLQTAKPVPPAPVSAPVAAPTPKPMVKFRVTQRDENGRIVSIEQTA